MASITYFVFNVYTCFNYGIIVNHKNVSCQYVIIYK
nr:MAG TPA: hypothetical protein [Caudoviricetes sp.]